jgi:uncharacterized protein (UPF0297 family)
MKQKYISGREKVKKAIIEIVKNKKNEGVEPVFAMVGDIVSHTGMYISDVNCELSMLRSSGVIKQVVRGRLYKVQSVVCRVQSAECRVVKQKQIQLFDRNKG